MNRSSELSIASTSNNVNTVSLVSNVVSSHLKDLSIGASVGGRESLITSCSFLSSGEAVTSSLNYNVIFP